MGLVGGAIRIVSARDQYSDCSPQHPKLWKTLAFKKIVKDHFNLYSSSDHNIYTIISIGDSEDEYVASYEAKQMILTMNQLNRTQNNVRLHRVKLMEEPTVEEMLGQIALLMGETALLLT